MTLTVPVTIVLLSLAACFPGPLPPEDAPDTTLVTDDTETTAADSASEVDTEVTPSQCDDVASCDPPPTCQKVACVEHRCVVSDDDTASCSDDERCTIGDHCSAGRCVAAPKTCPDSGDSCRENVCDPETGACGSQPANPGASCDNVNPCTMNDVCVDGACAGTERECISDDTCQVDGACEATSATTFICDYDERPDDAGCDDGDHCTIDEQCTGGECGGGSLPTDDDWLHRHEALTNVDNQALAVDTQGRTWWAVSVSEPETQFGDGVSLALPDGSNTGIALVELSSAGVPLSARWLVHSSGSVRFANAPGRKLRVVEANIGGSVDTRIFVFATFTAPIIYRSNTGSEVTATPRHTRSYFLAAFDADLNAQQFHQIESDRLPTQSQSPYLFASAGIGPTGDSAIAIPVSATRDAEIVGRASAPTTTQGTSTWVVAFTPAGVIDWQGEIASAPAPANGGGGVESIDVDETGSVWLSGSVFGAARWTRTDGSAAATLPTPIGLLDAMFIRLTSSGELADVAQFTGFSGILAHTELGTVSADGQRYAGIMYFTNELYVVESGTSRLILADDPVSDQEHAIITLDATGHLLETYRARTRDVWWLEYRDDALVVVLGGSSGLTRDGNALWNSLAPGTHIGGVPIDGGAPWVFALLTATGTGAALTNYAFASSGRYGVVAGGISQGADVIIDGTAEPVVDATGLVMRTNSGDGRACRGQ